MFSFFMNLFNKFSVSVNKSVSISDTNEFKISSLSSLSNHAFLYEFKKIPPNTNKLDISDNWLYRAGKVFVDAFKLIPLSVDSINLSNNKLFVDTLGYSQMLIACIPKTVKTLNLSNNAFHDREGPKLDIAALTNAINAIPRSVVNLDLSDNYFGRIPADKLIVALKGLPANLRKLNLGNNLLCKFTPQELIDILKALPPNLQELDLSGNYLSDFGENLSEILNAIPPSVRKLNLGKNDLGNMYGDFSIPAHITNLGLNTSSICYRMKIFEAMPKNLFALDLSNNHLAKKPIFNAIPKSVRVLNIASNGIDKLSPEKLGELNGLLPNVKGLFVGQSEIERMTLENRKALVAIFPNLERVTFLDDNYMVLDGCGDDFLHNLTQSKGSTKKTPSLVELTSLFVKQHATLEQIETNLPQELQERIKNYDNLSGNPFRY